MKKEKSFNRGHFPFGTEVVIHVDHRDEEIHGRVLECTSNGPDSWVIKIDTAQEVVGHHYNIHHVKRIIKRGHDNLQPAAPARMNIPWYGRLSKHPSQYAGSVHDLCFYLINKLARGTDHLYDGDMIAQDVFEATLYCSDKYGRIVIGKRKLRKIIWASMQRNRLNRANEQRNDDACIGRMMEEDFDRELGSMYSDEEFDKAFSPIE